MGQVTPPEEGAQPSLAHIDETSYDALAEILSELREYYGLETNPGREAWLSEIIEDFGRTMGRLKPSQMQATIM